MTRDRRRCYCDRLYPGFKCAYCRVADYIADDVQPDPRELAKAAAETRKQQPAWWTKMIASGKAILRRTS